MPQIGRKRRFQKGEVATFITIGALLLLGAVSLASSYLLQKGRLKTKPRAESAPTVYVQTTNGRQTRYMILQNGSLWCVDRLGDGKIWDAWDINNVCWTKDNKPCPGYWNFHFGYQSVAPPLPAEFANKWKGLVRNTSKDSVCREAAAKLPGGKKEPITPPPPPPKGSSGGPGDSNVGSGNTSKTWVSNGCYKVNVKFRPIKWIKEDPQGNKENTTGFLAWVEVETKDGRGGNAQLWANGRHVAGINALSDGRLVWGPEWTQNWAPGRSVPVAAISGGSTQVVYETDLDSCGAQRKLSVACTLTYTGLGKGTVSGQGCWCEGENCTVPPTPTPTPRPATGGGEAAGGGGKAGEEIGGGIDRGGKEEGKFTPVQGSGKGFGVASSKKFSLIDNDKIKSCEDLDKLISQDKIGIIQAEFFGKGEGKLDPPYTFKVFFNFDVERLTRLKGRRLPCFTVDNPIINFPGVLNSFKNQIKVDKNEIEVDIGDPANIGDSEEFNSLENAFNNGNLSLSLNYCLKSERQIIDREGKWVCSSEESKKQFLIPVEKEGNYGGGLVYKVFNDIFPLVDWKGEKVEKKALECSDFTGEWIKSLKIVGARVRSEGGRIKLELEFNKDLRDLQRFNCLMREVIIFNSIGFSKYEVNGNKLTLDVTGNYEFFSRLRRIEDLKVYFQFCSKPSNVVGINNGFVCYNENIVQQVIDFDRNSLGDAIDEIKNFTPIFRCSKPGGFKFEYSDRGYPVIRFNIEPSSPEGCLNKESFFLEGPFVEEGTPIPRKKVELIFYQGNGKGVLNLPDGLEVVPGASYTLTYEYCPGNWNFHDNTCVGSNNEEVKYSTERIGGRWPPKPPIAQSPEEFVYNPHYKFKINCRDRRGRRHLSWPGLALYAAREKRDDVLEIKKIRDVSCGREVELDFNTLSEKFSTIPSLSEISRPGSPPAGSDFKLILELAESDAKIAKGRIDTVFKSNPYALTLTFPSDSEVLSGKGFIYDPNNKIWIRDYGNIDFAFDIEEIKKGLSYKTTKLAAKTYIDMNASLKLEESDKQVEDDYQVEVYLPIPKNRRYYYEDKLSFSEEVDLLLQLGPKINDSRLMYTVSALGYDPDLYIKVNISGKLVDVLEAREAPEFLLKRVCTIGEEGTDQESVAYLPCLQEGNIIESKNGYKIFAQCSDESFGRGYPPECDVARCQLEESIEKLMIGVEGLPTSTPPPPVNPKVFVGENSSGQCKEITEVGEGVNFIFLNYSSQEVIVSKVTIKDDEGWDEWMIWEGSERVSPGGYFFRNYLNFTEYSKHVNGDPSKPDFSDSSSMDFDCRAEGYQATIFVDELVIKVGDKEYNLGNRLKHTRLKCGGFKTTNVIDRIYFIVELTDEFLENLGKPVKKLRPSPQRYF